ncbi:androgen-induced gene 1 protein-like isoform X8 [Cimex lectularius]|uniref:Androgen-induced gene 1 protein-like n=1 Tax=Cimex lectularius TaxID=79782 RepID=A0A8I6S599_CIMLE|nr:androgen-induced gene 1 protein-like isoform X8 [Cimex lectularius]
MDIYVHLSGAGHMLLTILCDYHFFNEDPIHYYYDGSVAFYILNRTRYLSYLSIVTQACYFSLCVFIDIWGSKNDQNERNVLVRIKDYVEASIAFPIAMFVGVTFWGLMAVDRELVLPAALDPYFPSWLNHMMHTNILIFQFLEIITSTRVYPQRKHALVGLMTFQTTYLIWMHIVHYKSGVWAYPIFEKLNVPLRIGFFVGCFTLGGLMYFLGEKLHYLLWQKGANERMPHPNVKYDPNAVSQ